MNILQVYEKTNQGLVSAQLPAITKERFLEIAVRLQIEGYVELDNGELKRITEQDTTDAS